MENKKPSNPSAFPVVLPGNEKKGWDADIVEGMTLRDYFANSAMIIMKAPNNYVGEKETQESFNCFAKMAYDIADAMLKQREL